MLQLKGPYEAEDVQSHLGNVYRMSVAVSHRQTAGHHIGIADGFYLWGHALISGSAPWEDIRIERKSALNAHTNRGWELSKGTVLCTSLRASSMPVSPGNFSSSSQLTSQQNSYGGL